MKFVSVSLSSIVILALVSACAPGRRSVSPRSPTTGQANQQTPGQTTPAIPAIGADVVDAMGALPATQDGTGNIVVRLNKQSAVSGSDKVTISIDPSAAATSNDKNVKNVHFTCLNPSGSTILAQCIHGEATVTITGSDNKDVDFKVQITRAGKIPVTRIIAAPDTNGKYAIESAADQDPNFGTAFYTGVSIMNAADSKTARFNETVIITSAQSKDTDAFDVKGDKAFPNNPKNPNGTVTFLIKGLPKTDKDGNAITRTGSSDATISVSSEKILKYNEIIQIGGKAKLLVLSLDKTKGSGDPSTFIDPTTGATGGAQQQQQQQQNQNQQPQAQAAPAQQDQPAQSKLLTSAEAQKQAQQKSGQQPAADQQTAPQSGTQTQAQPAAGQQTGTATSGEVPADDGSEKGEGTESTTPAAGQPAASGQPAADSTTTPSTETPKSSKDNQSATTSSETAKQAAATQPQDLSFGLKGSPTLFPKAPEVKFNKQLMEDPGAFLRAPSAKN